MIIFGVALSVVLILVVGIVVARKVDGDSANYLVAGRRLGVPLVAVSLTAAAVDANATVGNTDLTSQFGFWSRPKRGANTANSWGLNRRCTSSRSHT